MDDTIPISYADSRKNVVPRRNILTSFFMRERKSVLFVCEGDFTLTVAFAALREFEVRKKIVGDLQNLLQGFDVSDLKSDKVWEGILSARYEPAGSESVHQFVGNKSIKCKPVGSLVELKLDCINHIVRYVRQTERTNEDQQSLLAKIETVSHLPSVPDSYAWQFNLDPLHIPPGLIAPGRAIWFQCPWSVRESGEEVHTLIRQFLLNIADQLTVSNYVCVGITKKYPYTKGYSLESILGSRLVATDGTTEVLKQYVFCGADDQLIYQLLSCGYSCGRPSIFKEILEDHLTLVFKKK